jgi:hypothetical protein
VRSAVAFVLAFALAIAVGDADSLGTAAAGPDCRLHAGDKVVLYSAGGDPSVFVWDSPVRLRDYNAASYDEAQAMAFRATLVAGGTRALVASCRAGYVQSPYSEKPDDAVGITIITGPHRGHNFWVLSSDVRGVYHAMGKMP